MTEQSLEKESKTSLSIWARIVLIIISYFILAGIFQFVGGLIMNVPITNLTALKNMSINQLLILELCSFTALVIVMFRFRKFIDKKTILSMGFSFKNRIKDIIAGFIIALFIIGGGSLILYVLDYINLRQKFTKESLTNLYEMSDKLSGGFQGFTEDDPKSIAKFTNAEEVRAELQRLKL